MEDLKPTKLISFNPNQMNAVRQSFGYDSLQDVNNTLDSLEDWISKQTHFVVKKFDRDYLERQLMAAKGSVERTKNHLDKLCTYRTLQPEFMKDLALNVKEEYRNFLSLGYISLLPKPTPDNYRVFFSKIYTEDFENFSLVDYTRYMLVLLNYMLLNDYSTGLIMVIDYEHINMSLLPKMNPVTIQKARSIIVEGYGMRLKAIIFINSSKLLETLVMIVKQGLTEKLKNRVHVLNKPEDLVNYIPKNILPKEYGGDEISVTELHDKTLEEMSADENVKQMMEMEKAVTDESVRDTTKYNEEILGMPGSFKALNVD